MRRARDLGRNDLILSHFSLRRADFDARLAAAAAAGFAGIGLFIGEYERLREAGRTDAELCSALEAHGLVLAEIEVLSGWSASGASRTRADAWLDTACHMAEVFSARHVQAIGPYEGTFDDAACAFARVCDRAADVGLHVALEFLPPTNIPDAGVALALVERAGRANSGLCLDTWHHFRGARDWELLRKVPGERVVSIQLDDGMLAAEDPDFYADTTRNRRLFGAGEFDLPRFLGMLDEIGAAGPRSLEVISSALELLAPREAARRIAESFRALTR
jgi:sugar phosphate isomerase/epimerase